MINALIRFSLANRPLILGLALIALVYSAFVARQLPVDVLPDLTRPTVTLLAESPGLAPEEAEALVTIPLENAVAGAPGIVRLRSSSDVGLSLIFIEFDWGTDVYHARQVVQERLQTFASQLPQGVTPVMGPVSSLLGEILLVGLRSEDASTAPMDLRTIADNTVARRLQAIPGVSQVLAIGGGVRQLHILPDPERMATFGIRLAQVHQAAAEAAGDTNSGYITGPAQEFTVRNLGMTTDPADFAATPLSTLEDGTIIYLGDVAKIQYGPGIMRGDAGVNGSPGVILSIQKAPGTDTLQLTRTVENALAELAPALPAGVTATVLFRQAGFIEHALANLTAAIRDGAIMVAVILFLFLLNLRTTFITLTAIPLSFAITIIIFQWLGIGINSMTLGGIAVAIGMVVDDAIVDVENVYRRLRENRSNGNIRPIIEVVGDASAEIRSAIFYATILIVLVFLPLFGLTGLEGQLFAPIATATIVSMLGSFIVAVTVIPVLASLLLPGMKRMQHNRDSRVVQILKNSSRRFLIAPALAHPFPVLGLTAIGVSACFALWPVMGKSFLPPFNEGSAIVSMVAAPGTSLRQSNQLGMAGEQILLGIPEVKSVGRRTGRAELDEHVMPVSVNEFDLEFHTGGRPRSVVLQDIRTRLSTIPGVYLNVGQPISHRIDHMLSGVEAQLAVKIYGDNLSQLRASAAEVERLMLATPGLTDVQIERQLSIPQIQIIPDRARAATHGLRTGALNTWLSEAIGGKTVGQLREHDRPIDVFVRLPESARNDPQLLQNLWVDLPAGGHLPLGQIAEIRESEGPNLIHRENGRRRIIISANAAAGRDLISIVSELHQRSAQLKLPEGYYLSFEGQYRSQREALQRILWLSILTLTAMTFLLYGHFRSIMLVAQTLLNIPLACAGALALTWLVIGEISLATLIGMIALAGIASRNTIMMLSHYIHLMRYENESFTENMIIRGTLERLVPVTMTALTAAIALLPIALAPDAPGKEILHPVAIAIIGGLVTSTLLDCIVTPTVFYHFAKRK